MRRARANGPLYTGVRAALALLVAVVALLCVVGHAQRDSPTSQPSVVELTQLSTFVDTPSGTAAPCGKKAVADQATQRHDGAPRVHDCSGCPTGGALVPEYQEPCRSDYSAGPAPPPALPLHSVLRI